MFLLITIMMMADHWSIKAQHHVREGWYHIVALITLIFNFILYTETTKTIHSIKENNIKFPFSVYMNALVAHILLLTFCWLKSFWYKFPRVWFGTFRHWLSFDAVCNSFHLWSCIWFMCHRALSCDKEKVCSWVSEFMAILCVVVWFYFVIYSWKKRGYGVIF